MNGNNYFATIAPWKRECSYLNNVNTLNPRMFCAKFGWNRLSGSGEEDKEKRKRELSAQVR